jgi:hypothetical protein
VSAGEREAGGWRSRVGHGDSSGQYRKLQMRNGTAGGALSADSERMCPNR